MMARALCLAALIVVQLGSASRRFCSVISRSISATIFLVAVDRLMIFAPSR